MKKITCAEIGGGLAAFLIEILIHLRFNLRVKFAKLDLSKPVFQVHCLAPYVRPLICGFSNKISGAGGRMFNA